MTVLGEDKRRPGPGTGFRYCPKCEETNRIQDRICKNKTCRYEFPRKGNGGRPKKIHITPESNIMLAKSISNVSFVPASKIETEDVKRIRQGAFHPDWSYLGEHRFLDVHGNQVGPVTYNAYCKKYSNEVISKGEFYMLVGETWRLIYEE